MPFAECREREPHTSQSFMYMKFWDLDPEVLSFFDNMSGLLGCLIVTQPSEISALGMRHAVYSVKLDEVPIAESMRRGYSPSIVAGGHRLC
jgi:hypothetical protein